MSTAITQMESLPADVIVRAFGDEPVRLKAIRQIRDDVIEVQGVDESKSIGFPSEMVFRFNSRLYSELRKAFDARKSRLLASAWKQAEPLMRSGMSHG